MDQPITLKIDGGENPERDEKLLFSVDETRNLLSVSRWQVYDLMWKKELGSITIGRRRLIPVKSIHDFIDRRLKEGGRDGKTL